MSLRDLVTRPPFSTRLAPQTVLPAAMTKPSIPPGPRGLPFLGNAVEFLSDPLGLLTRSARRYGDVVRLRLGAATCYSVNHPDLVDEVLNRRSKCFSKARDLSDPTEVHSALGDGLFTSEGAVWLRQRHLAQPMFSPSEVRAHGLRIQGMADRLCADWRPGAWRDVFADLSQVTLEFAAEALFGLAPGQRTASLREDLATMNGFMANPLQWSWLGPRFPTPACRRFRRAVKRMQTTFFDLIRERRERDVGRLDLLGRWLAARDEHGNPLPDDLIRDECLTFFATGHETTALALTYSLHLLSRHPECDARLAEELTTVLEGRAATPEDVPALRYTECVLLESMRMYPPAWWLAREATEDTELGGYEVPRSTKIILSQWLLHRDSRWFDEPLAFRPERWDGDLIHRLPRGAYFPFGHGPRVCVGRPLAFLEAVLLLAAVARRWRFMPTDRKALRLAASFTLRPRGGLPLLVEHRAEPRPATGGRLRNGDWPRYSCLGCHT